MAFRQLVDADCGGNNALLKLNSQLNKNRSKLESDGLLKLVNSVQSDLVSEFVGQNTARNDAFRMDKLFSEVNHVTVDPNQQGSNYQNLGARPKNRALAQEWASDFAIEHAEHSLESAWTQSANPNLSVQDYATQNGQTWVEDFLKEDTLPILNSEHQELQEIADQVLGPDVQATQDKEWAQEFEGDKYKEDFWEKLQNEWAELAQNEDHDWAKEFSENYDPFEKYEFSEENPLKDLENPLEEGKKKLTEGDIPSAVLLFEAAVQKDDSNPEAWTLLGTTQAKNEQDQAAIPALRKAVALQPDNMQAIMALAVSYTNENYQSNACHALQDWLKQNPNYSHLAGGSTTLPKHSTSSFMSSELHTDTLNRFLSAAKAGGTTFDPDVQVGLGILFNLSSDYEKAADCLKSALAQRPEDSLLWNKLGATLANGNKSEEAVSAYHNALKLSPGFIRARYNLGISCINLKAYSEAMDHFLTSLNFQAAGRGLSDQGGGPNSSAMSDSIWRSMRFCASLLDRQDVYPDIDSRNLDKLNSIFKK